MAQWGQPQYPMQTGFQPGMQPQMQPGVQPQLQQGFPPGMQSGLQPGMQQMPGQMRPGFIQSQPTGYVPQQQLRPAPPPPPVPSQFSQFNQLQAQPTGFAPLVAQPTGFVDPRLQMMSQSFMPTNTAVPYSPSGAPLLQPQQGPGLVQSFQSHNQQARGTAAPKIPWALNKSEKKQYDSIFRAWDAQSTGFISGETALNVFGQSGLPKDDLAKIWSLADVDDRGKLNKAEFHVAMGLVYRRLNGNDMPETLPAELVPPSSKDLDNSVDILKDLLKHESRNRSPASLDQPLSRMKDRSFHSSGGNDPGRDATIYKHSDDTEGIYSPRNRHVDRSAIRSRNQENDPNASLSDMKRSLAATSSMLDRTAEADASRTREDEELEREMGDLRYRVKRVQEDLDYLSRGPRSHKRDEDRRRLERELLELTHTEVPDLERRIKRREEEKEQERRQWGRDRDKRNDRFGRFDSREDERERPQSRGYDDFRDREYERDRPYSRGPPSDRPYSRGPPPDRSYSSSYDRDRPVSRGNYDDPPYSRGPPEAPPTKEREVPPPPAIVPPAPTPSRAMTKEERQAEAQRRIQERMAALGVTAPPSSSPAPTSPNTVDASVDERLKAEREEAQKKAQLAEKDAEERERHRKERLDREKGISSRPPTEKKPTPTPSAPQPSKSAMKPPAPPPPKSRNAPPPPKPRAVAPTPPKAPVISKPAPPTIAPPPEQDPEELELRRREESLIKAKVAREERRRQLEREEEEELKREEAEEMRRKERKAARAKPPASPPASIPSPVSASPPAPVAFSQPPLPSAPTPSTDKSSTNPFSKLIREGSQTSPPAQVVSSNPWASMAAADTPPVPSPPVPPPVSNAPSPGPPKSASSIPPPVKSSYNVASTEDDDDWDTIKEKDLDESSSDSDDETFGAAGRSQRANIANAIFGGKSSTPTPPAASPIPPSSATIPPPPPPSAPAPPPPPAAPPAPRALPLGDSDPSANRGALFASIQGGKSLKSVKTVDRSGAALSGKVIGDTAPPEHIKASGSGLYESSPRAESPGTMPGSFDDETPPPQAVSNDKSSNRQSVDWYAGLAADNSNAATVSSAVDRLPSTMEEAEEEFAQEQEQTANIPLGIPSIRIDSEPIDAPDLMQDIDKAQEYRTRTLYLFNGDGPDDLSFPENVILLANPSKSGGDWWFGTLVKDGRSGLFPKSYVQEVYPCKAKAVYPYSRSDVDELSFDEGEVVHVIDNSEDEWWKAERDGAVFIVPAAYLEIIEDQPISSISIKARDGANIPDPTPEQAPQDSLEQLDNDDSDNESWSSFGDSDSDGLGNAYPETSEERRAREHERQLVLEAAGLIIQKDDKIKPPPRPARRKSRRPAPAAPTAMSTPPHMVAKDLPALPPVDSKQHLDDAFNRYETFKSHQHRSRLSIASTASFETALSSPTSVVSPVASKEEGKSYSSFMSFLVRSKTPVDESKPRPIISGPIAIVQSNSEDTSRAQSPAFGVSWASLVDKAALEDIPTKERKRQEAIFEFIATESAYVRDLQLIVEVFYSSMLPMLETKAITVIFANVEDILLVNTTFMSDLEERQKQSRLYINKIGDILKRHISNMGLYMEYCVNQGNAIKVLNSLRSSNTSLATHLQILRDEDPALRNLDLSSYLLVPLQRITRYPLLIKQVLHYTEGGTEDYSNIQKSLTIAERILENINESVREQEGRERLTTISQHLWIGQGRLDLTAPTRFLGARRLLKEGPLSKAKSGKKLQAFLCSDILVLTDESEKNLYRLPIPLTEAKIPEVPNRDDFGFQIRLPYPRGGDVISLKAPSARDCEMWVRAIENAALACREGERRSQRSNSRFSSV